jgi:hypothetical protein
VTKKRKVQISLSQGEEKKGDDVEVEDDDDVYHKTE